MLLIIRFAFILLFFACIIALPFFLLKLNEMEKKKKVQKEREENQRIIQSKTASYELKKELYLGATPKIRELFVLIETKLTALQSEKKYLSLEAAHHLTETFPKDFKNYQTLYGNIKDKQSVEQEAIESLEKLVLELKTYEKEIEEKKKVALHRQGYIMETREKNHL